MDIHTNIPLKNYTTMRLGGNARFMADVSTPDDLAAACRNAKSQNIPFFILGSGSNVIVHDEGYNGIVIRNSIKGVELIEDDPSSSTLRVGAGENWDELVAKTVEAGLSGIEALSSIPGTAGAAPVQNIGAYGQELADCLVNVEAYDSELDQFVTLDSTSCGFSYRHSIFRGSAKGRYGITAITLKLYKSSPKPPFYAALQTYLDQQGITLYSPQTIREAVSAIRAEKLPDPKVKPNSGSFFKNAIVEDWQLTDLHEKWPDMPTYNMGDKKYKVPTGWLIEQTGLKGQLLNGMRVHDKNALVLINESATSYADLAEAREQITIAVRNKFRIEIEQEPLEM